MVLFRNVEYADGRCGKRQLSCAYYYQNPDKSDLGTWRLPNEAELMIMSGSLFDWDDREKKDVL